MFIVIWIKREKFMSARRFGGRINHHAVIDRQRRKCHEVDDRRNIFGQRREQSIRRARLMFPQKSGKPCGQWLRKT